MRNRIKVEQMSLLPEPPPLSKEEKAEIISDFEQMLVEAVRSGGGAHCVNAMEEYLRKRRYVNGLQNRRFSHKSPR